MSWFGRLLTRWRDRPDPAWSPTGIRQVYSGHDESKAVNAAKRQKELDADRRELASARSGVVRSIRGAFGKGRAR